MSVKVFLGIAIVASLISCSDLKRPAQLERLAEGQARLDSIDLVIEEIDYEKLVLIEDAAASTKEQVDALDLDTIDYGFAIQLDRFNSMGLGSVEVRGLMEILREDVVTEKDVLMKLSNDIEGGSGKREMYDEYIQFELDKIEVLRIRLNTCTDRMTEVLDVYDELNVVLEDRLNERNTVVEVH